MMRSHLSVAQCQVGLFSKIRSISNIVAERTERGMVIVGSPNSETSNVGVGLGQARGLLRCRQAEPSLDELFGDDAIQLLMRRDGVTESEVRVLLAKMREALTGAGVRNILTVGCDLSIGRNQSSKMAEGR